MESSDIGRSAPVYRVDWDKDAKHRDPREEHGSARQRDAAASYGQTAAVLSDDVTLLGMPVSQMSAETRAAVTGLLAEVEHLRAITAQRARAGEAAPGGRISADVFATSGFQQALEEALSANPASASENQCLFSLYRVENLQQIATRAGGLYAMEVLDAALSRLARCEGVRVAGPIGAGLLGALWMQAGDEGAVLEKGRQTLASAPDPETESVSVHGAVYRVLPGQDAVQVVSAADYLLRNGEDAQPAGAAAALDEEGPAQEQRTSRTL